MVHFEEDDVKDTDSQERLESAKAFFEMRVAANQSELDRVNTDLETATGDRKKFLIKSKAGYEAKIQTANAVLTKANDYLLKYEIV